MYTYIYIYIKIENYCNNKLIFADALLQTCLGLGLSSVKRQQIATDSGQSIGKIDFNTSKITCACSPEIVCVFAEDTHHLFAVLTLDTQKNRSNGQEKTKINHCK